MTMDMRLAIEQQLLRADADEATSVIVLRGGRAQFLRRFRSSAAGAATSGRGGTTR